MHSVSRYVRKRSTGRKGGNLGLKKPCISCGTPCATTDNTYCDDCFLKARPPNGTRHFPTVTTTNTAPIVPSCEGLKYDDEKPRMDLLDPEFLEEVAAVMTFGAKKYAAHNWRKGLAVSRLLAAALRHIFAVLRGEDHDPESSKSHIAHATCCLMFAFWMLKHRADLDDRYDYAGKV